jgi:DNA replication protein DnaC
VPVLPGVGKTHLVVGIGVRAIEQGFSCAFYRLEDLLHQMRKDATVSPQALRRKKYFNVSYLVVDEVGFEPMSREDAGLFFRLVSYRYCRGSTAITTNKVSVRRIAYLHDGLSSGHENGSLCPGDPDHATRQTTRP